MTLPLLAAGLVAFAAPAQTPPEAPAVTAAPAVPATPAAPATSAAPAPTASKASSPAKKKVSKPKRPRATVTPARPVSITAKSFEVLPGTQKAIWKGDVLATRDDLKIQCDTMIADYDSKNQLKVLTCKGNAHLVQKPASPDKPEREAWGDLAVFDNAEARITVTGSPRAREGLNTMTGSKVTFFVDQERLLVDDAVITVDSAKTTPLLEQKP